MTVGSDLLIDRAAQIECLDNRRRAQIEACTHNFAEPLVGHLARAYAIGVAQPVSVLVDSYGTGKVADERLGEIVRECFDLRPSAIIKTLDLRRPIYQQVAAYGHFGRPELDLPWEKVDRVQELLAKA